MKYGTLGALDEGLPAVQEQSQTTTILDLDGTSTTGWQGDTSYLSIDGTDAFEWDGMTSNNQAYYEFPNGAVTGDLTVKVKMKWDGNGDGAGLFLVDTSSSGFGNGAWGNQDMAGAFWANQGWTYDRSYEDGVGSVSYTHLTLPTILLV